MVYSQDFPAMDSVEFCCEQNDLDSAFRTYQFKHILTLELTADRIYFQGRSQKAKVKHKEKFVEFTTFIKLSRTMAIEFAVIRAYKNDVRFYLINVMLYAIKDKKWRQVSTHKWEFLQLGKIYPSKYYGRRGSKDYYGFDGTFLIY